MRRSGYRQTRLVLFLLLAVDMFLIALSILHARGVLIDPRFSVSKERGFGEMFQYAKYGVSAVILFRGAFRGYGRTAALWGVLFVGLLCEDAFTIHERLGWRIAARLHLPSIGAMEAHQLGETVVAAVEGGGFLFLLGVMLWSAPPVSRTLSVVLLAGLAALGLFGVVVDALHSLTPRQSILDPVLDHVEDGGEMIAASLLLWIAWVWRDP